MISLILPSRSRPGQSVQTAKKWLDQAGCDIEFFLSLDMDDPELNGYRQVFRAFGINGNMVIMKNRSAIDAINNAAKQATGNIIMHTSDDFVAFDNWGQDILYAVECKKDFLLKTDDGTQGWIATLPIMDRAFYESQGFFYDPRYAHQFPDTHMTHVADLTGRLIIRNDIHFKHNHSSMKDKVRDNTNSTWNQGKKIYLDECENRFGLGDIDIYKLSLPYAQRHIDWLKRELAHK